MRVAMVVSLVLCLGVICVTLPASATIVTSSYSNFVYSYTVTPTYGDSVRDFHVYAGVSECGHAFTNVVMPPGWNFMLNSTPTKCVITWWTTTNPLAPGIASSFGYKHYCAPCCHSWFVTEVGSPDPLAEPIDGSWNYPTVPCNIPVPYNDLCHGGGLVVAPIYPQQTPVDMSTWGRVKVLYR